MSCRKLLFLLCFLFSLDASADQLRDLIHRADSLVFSYWNSSNEDFIEADWDQSYIVYTTPSGRHAINSFFRADEDTIDRIEYAYFEYPIDHPLFRELSNDSIHFNYQKIFFTLDGKGKLKPGARNEGLVKMAEDLNDIKLFPVYECCLAIVTKFPKLSCDNAKDKISWLAFKDANGKDSVNAAGIAQGKFVYTFTYTYSRYIDRNSMNLWAVDCYYADIFTGRLIALKKENESLVFVKK